MTLYALHTFHHNSVACLSEKGVQQCCCKPRARFISDSGHLANVYTLLSAYIWYQA